MCALVVYAVYKFYLRAQRDEVCVSGVSLRFTYGACSICVGGGSHCQISRVRGGVHLVNSLLNLRRRIVL